MVANDGILFCKKEKDVLCVYTDQPLVTSENELSCPAALLSSALGGSRTVCVLRSLFFPSSLLPHRKQKAALGLGCFYDSVTSSSTDLACWLL